MIQACKTKKDNKQDFKPLLSGVNAKRKGNNLFRPVGRGLI